MQDLNRFMTISIRGKLIVLLVFANICSFVSASDTIKSPLPQFISFQTSGGFLIPSRKIDSRERKAPGYAAFTLKYGFGSQPYRGIGAYIPRFSERKHMGDPYSVFLFQGGTLRQISPTLSLNYEINLGTSFNWNHYKEYTNTQFTALGSSTNVHVGGSGYFKWRLSQKFDLHTGISFTHFSNGATRTPNNGVNTPSAFVEVSYYLNRDESKAKTASTSTFIPSLFEKKGVHDLSFLFTTRTLKIDKADMEGTELISKYPRHKFKVFGVNYSYMFHNRPRFMFGPSIEAVYDESVNALALGGKHPETEEYKEYVFLSKKSDRFSAGLSLKGEFKMPGYSIIGNLGYNFLHKDRRDKKLYQIYGVKFYLTEHLYATFGVRSSNISRSQYLHLNVGYAWSKCRKKKAV